MDYAMGFFRRRVPPRHEEIAELTALTEQVERDILTSRMDRVSFRRAIEREDEEAGDWVAGRRRRQLDEEIADIERRLATLH